MKNWRKPMPRIEEQLLARAIVAQSVGDPKLGEPPRVLRGQTWRVRVLAANFLHAGSAPAVGSELSIEADLAADLIARKLCELISKPAPRPRDPRSTW